MKAKLTAWLPPLILLAAGILYLFTLDSGLRPDELTGGDLITHQYAQVQARPSNAPGYPLYTMLGWAWFRVGRWLLGWALNPIQILSLYSTLWGLASLWVLYQLLLRPEVAGRNWLLAALLTLFYATTYFFWYYSVTTEQYTSAIFQTLLLVWLVFAWEAKPTNRTLWLMAFLGGTMLANMLTTLFILPPLLYLIFTKRPELLSKAKLMGQTIAIGLLPLLSYAYVYIRGAQHPEWRGQGNWASTGDWFLHFISTQQGRDELTPGLTLQNLFTPEFPSLIWGELTWLVLAGGLVGLAMLGRRKAIFFFGTLAIYAIFVTLYRFGNWFQVILPLYPLLVLGFGRTTGWLWGRFPMAWARGALVLALVVLLAYRFSLSLPRANQRNLLTDTGLDLGWAILADVAGPGWSISADFTEWLALQYLTEIWGVEPELHLVEPGSPGEFVTRRAVEAYPRLMDPGAIHPQAVGANLIRRGAEPKTSLPPSATQPPMDLDFGGLIHLAAYEVVNGGQLVILYWTALAPIPVDYTISVRLWRQGQQLENEHGSLIQDHQPVWNTYPTSRWQPGEFIGDAYTFSLLPQTQPDQLQIVIYQATASGFENLGAGFIDLR